jgi:hypothetical protein
MAKAMTESKWLAASMPQEMLNSQRTGNARKLRLFACACCRHVWNLIPDERSRRAIEAAELWADSLLSTKNLRPIQVAARAAQDEYTMAPSYQFGEATGEAICEAACVALPNKAWVWTVANFMRAACAIGRPHSAIMEAEAAQVQFLRDIFGNPFHPVTLDPAWLTPNVKALAQKIYDDRAFDRLPSLADELEKAGCANPEILGHLRGPGPHVRGCWVVDLVLGKE